MEKLDMTNFKYENGNSVEFDGFFGHVQMMYFAEAKDNSFDFLTDGKPAIIPSHFTAYLMDGETCKLSASGSGPETALKNLYTECAKYRALEDMGRI